MNICPSLMSWPSSPSLMSWLSSLLCLPAVPSMVDEDLQLLLDPLLWGLSVLLPLFLSPFLFCASSLLSRLFGLARRHGRDLLGYSISQTFQYENLAE